MYRRMVSSLSFARTAAFTRISATAVLTLILPLNSFPSCKYSFIQAVQTLSRLNRKTNGKTDTFVLDFFNEPDDIYKSFKPYYELTEKGVDVDPQHLNTLAHTLENWKVYTTAEVNEWCEIWFRNRMVPTGSEHKRLNALLDIAVERFKKLGEEDGNLFKSQMISFRNLYSFVSDR